MIGKLKKWALPAAAAWLVLGTVAQMDGANAYLPQIGPAPLRFSVGTTRFSFTLPAILRPPVAPTNSTPIAAPSTNNVETNVLQYGPPTPAAPADVPMPVPTADAPNNPVQTPSASDMLIVSPQMLTEYFKPGSDDTNAVPPEELPAPVRFAPPVAAPSSQATYRSP